MRRMLVCARLTFLKNPKCQAAVWSWLEVLIHEASISEDQRVALLIGIITPILEGPIDWNNSTEMFIVDRLMRCAESQDTRWVLEAYIDFCPEDNPQRLRDDIDRYRRWCLENARTEPNITSESLAEFIGEWFG